VAELWVVRRIDDARMQCYVACNVACQQLEGPKRRAAPRGVSSEGGAASASVSDSSRAVTFSRETPRVSGTHL
jgi:hypothetical protein